ncbi:hypothetical protein BDZ89DRAFT_1164930 [Hymenopellis radicata]|nr:hypothetical protein BDZ89DRAFT_1164930 [Hymenopellis radicata]
MLFIVALVVFPSLVAAGVSRDRVHNARFLETRQEDTKIPALLRTPHPTTRDVNGLAIRQSGGSCDAGYLACDDGNGCCPVGDYCGTWSGKLGCCEIGQTCVANNNPCDYVGYSPCTGEDFCCPTGDTCSRDSGGNAQCTSGSGSGSGSASWSYLNPSFTWLASTTTGASGPTQTKNTSLLSGTGPTSAATGGGSSIPDIGSGSSGALSTGASVLAVTACFVVTVFAALQS